MKRVLNLLDRAISANPVAWIVYALLALGLVGLYMVVVR